MLVRAKLVQSTLAVLGIGGLGGIILLTPSLNEFLSYKNKKEERVQFRTVAASDSPGFPVPPPPPPTDIEKEEKSTDSEVTDKKALEV
ncbi:hypothetical protein MHLP_04085 [Candidatus Mycoplasma haematolamae str. Purdue]|uniref:Uncharacterized protein n=1 Tax=Mycoplasma haematolamae (strain Purdue) TaxID=1212765 RepID=I7C756_MYCHA|nr:hypothetical protein [Candidatus Mycoplasma haematolamae]AFO52397.1 hypothetical protein MHLP_04085 [Candidatus Mycoplasma haematolamae str. Purdue]